MREIARATGLVDSVKVAVLAALAITDELQTLRRQPRRESRGAARARRALPEACRARPATIRVASSENTPRTQAREVTSLISRTSPMATASRIQLDASRAAAKMEVELACDARVGAKIF